MVAFLIWTPVASAWSWPVHGPVLQPFSYDEAHPYDAGQHRGIDIGAAASGDAVVAPESGTVSFAGFVPTSGESVTIETADGYSVTLTHLGSIGVAKGAAVSEGDVVATVGPSGASEQTVPYVHLGVRTTSDPLGYLDPLGLLPATEPPPTSTPVPTPQPVTQAVPARERLPDGGLVVETPPAVSPRIPAPAEPAHELDPRSNPQATREPNPAPAARVFRTDAPQIHRLVSDPVAGGAPVAVTPFAHAIEAQPLALSIAAAVLAALLALAAAFMLGRRPARLLASLFLFRKELPLQRAA